MSNQERKALGSKRVDMLLESALARVWSMVLLACKQGWRQEFSDGEANFSDKGAKIWLSEYYKCQKSPTKSLFTFRLGASMLRWGL